MEKPNLKSRKASVVTRVLKAIDQEIERQTAQGKIAERNLESLRLARTQIEAAIKGEAFRLSDILPIMQDITAHFALLTEELTRSAAGLSVGKVSEALPKPGKITVPVSAPSSKPVTRKPRVVKEKPSRKGDINARAFKILRAAFGQPTMATRLEEALERAFGSEWRSKEISAFVSGGKPVKITFVQDLAGNTSQLRGALRQAVERLIEVEQKQPKVLPPMLATLYREIIGWRHSVADVRVVVKTWGVPIA